MYTKIYNNYVYTYFREPKFFWELRLVYTYLPQK